MIAGVVMNILLALVVATVIVFRQGQTTIKSTVVGNVLPIASAPQLAELRTRDTIRAVNGQPVQDWNSVDRERFPAFDSNLRQAMFEEPVRFFLDVVERDRSVLDFLYADYTIVNPILARHYGMPPPARGPDQWVRVGGAGRYGRGGLLPSYGPGGGFSGAWPFCRSGKS